MWEGRDGSESLLRPPDEEILTPASRALALAVALAVLTAACASGPTELVGSRASIELAGSRASPARSGGNPAAPAPSRKTAALDDPVERARFTCAVEVQRAQQFDPGRALNEGSLIGALVVGAAGASLGALFGLIGDLPGRGAAVGAIVGGGAGLMAGGLLRLHGAAAAYERGLAACMTAGTVAPPAAVPGLVEYRLRTLSLWHEAFTSFLTSAELMDGAAGPGLIRLADDADAGTLGRGVVLYDRHVAPVPASILKAFDATAVETRIKLGGAGHDFWDEARWYGKPGDRSVWTITTRNRRPQEVRRIGLSDATAIAHFRPALPPLFGATAQGAVVMPLGVLQHAEGRGIRSHALTAGLDPTRAITALVARDDNAAFPDRVYLVVTHAASAATYEALLAWGERAIERGIIEPRGP